MRWNSGPQIVIGSLYSWEFLGIPRNSKSSQNWSLPFPEIPSNSKLFKSELICIVGNFWEFLGIPRNSQEFPGIPRNYQKTGNSVCKGHLHNWEFLKIPRNFQKTGNSVRKGSLVSRFWIIVVQCFDLRLQSTAFFHFKLAYSKWRRHNHIELHENGFNKKVHTYFLKPRQFAIFILFYFHSTVFYIEWICVFPTQLKQTRIFFQLTVFSSIIIS